MDGRQCAAMVSRSGRGSSVLTLELKRAGESRKSAGLRPPGMLLKKDDGDRGRDGGVMALYLDAPPAAAFADPPSMSVKLVLANENDPGLEFAAGASMLPEDEVVIGERRRGRDRSRHSETGRGCACGEAVTSCPACTSGLAGTVEEGGDEVGDEMRRWREPELPWICSDRAARGYIGLEALTVDRSKLVEFDWRRSLARPASRRMTLAYPPVVDRHRGRTVVTWLRACEAGAQAGKVLGDSKGWWSRIVSLTCSNVQWCCRDQMD